MSYDNPPPAATPRPRQRRKGMGTAAKMGLLLFTALLVLGIVGAGVAVAGLQPAEQGPPRAPEPRDDRAARAVDRLGPRAQGRARPVRRVQPRGRRVRGHPAGPHRRDHGDRGRELLGERGLRPDRHRRRRHRLAPRPPARRLDDHPAARPPAPAHERQQRRSPSCPRAASSRRSSSRSASPRRSTGVDGKQRIIAAYLNQNYYGNESYGVAAAAQGYFGKELKDLTLAEAAIIAAIPQAPSAYDLVRNAEEQCVDPTEPEDACTKTQLVVPEDTRIVQRRNQVLDQMSRGRTPLTKDQFTDADFEAAKAEPVIVAPQKSTQWKANHFVWQVREELTAEAVPRARRRAPRSRRGGLDITSTLDWRMQRIAEKWVKAAAIVPHAKDPEAAAEAIKDPLPAVDGEPARQEAAQRRAHRAGLPDRRHRCLRRVGRRERDQGDQAVPAAVRRPRRRLAAARFGVQADRLRHRHRGPADHRRARCSWTS